MPKKKSTEELIEELAQMVGKGFAATATKDELLSVSQAIRDSLSAVERRLERVEFNTTGLGNRLETAEDRIRQIANKVGLRFN